MSEVGAEIIWGPVRQLHSWSLRLGLTKGGRELHCSLRTQLEGMNASLQAKMSRVGKAQWGQGPWCSGIDQRQLNTDPHCSLFGSGVLQRVLSQDGGGSNAEPLGGGLPLCRDGCGWNVTPRQGMARAGGRDLQCCRPGSHPWSVLTLPPGISLLQSSTNCSTLCIRANTDHF